MKYSFGVSPKWDVSENELECTVNSRELDLPTQNLIVPFCKKQYLRQAVVSAGPKEMGKIAEKIAEKKYELEPVKSDEFDYYMGGIRLEVKSSRAFVKEKRKVLVNARDLPFEPTYNCNIQQIKRDLFDELMYMIFAHDKIQVFIIKSGDIESADIGYSNKQHRNNEGEGQFHIHSGNYSLHIDMLVGELDYAECYDMLSTDKESMELLARFH